MNSAPNQAVAVSLKDILPSALENEAEEVSIPQLEFEFEFSDHDQEAEDEPQEVAEEEEEQFNLFGSAVKVSLKEEKEPEDPRVYAKRPDSHYFAQFNETQREKFRIAAVEGVGEVYRYDALHLPEKVIDYTELARKARLERIRMHRRPGKKARVARAAKLAKQKPFQPSAGPKYGPERVYTNCKINNTRKKRNKSAPVVRGVSGKGGHPRKGQK